MEIATQHTSTLKTVFRSSSDAGMGSEHVLRSALDGSSLSTAERESLLLVTRQHRGDADTAGQPGANAADLVEQFRASGEAAFSGMSIFDGVDLQRAPGDTLFNGLAGFLGAQVGQSLSDVWFASAVDALLGYVSGGESLQQAFANADLSLLSSDERSVLLCMVETAAAGGDISCAESRCIQNKLEGFLGVPVEPRVDATGQWSVEQQGNGRATIDLGNYQLRLNEHSSEMVLVNRETGESSRIWGDPHFDTDNDGDTDVDFWGTITLNLEDGTKITVNTTPYEPNPEMTVSSQLVITKGSQSMVVNGLDQNRIGDMTVETGEQGYVLDAMHGDGLDVYENGEGEGWMVQDGMWLRPVTQADMNQTKSDGADSLLGDLAALQGTVASMTLGMMLGSFFALGAAAADEWT